MLKKSISVLTLAFALVGGIFTASANAAQPVARSIQQQEQQGDKMQGDKMTDGKKKKKKKKSKKSGDKMTDGKMQGDKMKPQQ